MSAAALALLSAAAGAAHPAFAGIPHVTIVTYPVHGDTLTAIRASLDTRHPVDRHDGEEVEAITHWHFTWQWPGAHDGRGCDLAAASVRFAATVTLPRLVGLWRLPADVQAPWRRYAAALDAHEAGHVRHAWQHRGAVLAAIRHATCATAEAAGQAALREIVARDLAYDRETQHGLTQGASFP